MKPEMYRDAIRRAIRERRLIKFVYGEYPRVAEPHTLGVIKGVLQLLSYQVAGQSRSGKLPEWRLFFVSKISDFEITDIPFHSRPGPFEHHLQWDYKIAFVPSE